MAETNKEDRYLAPGTKVRLDSFVDDSHEPSFEFGHIVQCWFDNELGMFDCYIAFFGDAFPNGKPDEKPYILRYAAATLIVLAD